ncbi:hypothetical protein ACVIGA_005085 [Bradyrhizobium sp. USDA 3240]
MIKHHWRTAIITGALNTIAFLSWLIAVPNNQYQLPQFILDDVFQNAILTFAIPSLFVGLPFLMGSTTTCVDATSSGRSSMSANSACTRFYILGIVLAVFAVFLEGALIGAVIEALAEKISLIFKKLRTALEREQEGDRS